MTQDKSFLGTQPVGKLLVKLAVPTVISQIVNMLYNIIDRVYIGHIPGEGSLALTGMGICMPIILIISAFAALVASGGAPRASICMGKGDNESAEKILGGCFAMQIIISAILTIVLFIWDKPLLMAFGAEAVPAVPAETVYARLHKHIGKRYNHILQTCRQADFDYQASHSAARQPALAAQSATRFRAEHMFTKQCA